MFNNEEKEEKEIQSKNKVSSFKFCREILKIYFN